MKRSILLLFILTCSTLLKAQSPYAFNYQAVVRDADGNISANADVSFRISILENSEAGQAVYEETHNVNTSEHGLVNFQIGHGVDQIGDFMNIDWGAKPYFLNVEMDINGGSDYKQMAVQQLIAVPYALHANTVTNSDNDTANEIQDLVVDGEEISLTGSESSVVLSDLGHWKKINTDLYFMRGNVAVGTEYPQHDFNVVGDSAIINLGPSGTDWNKSAAGIIRFSEAGDYQNGLCGFQFNHNGVENKLSLEGGCLSTKDTLMTFKRTGGIGVNTYDPLYPLHVEGDLGVSQYIRHAGDNNTNLSFDNDEIIMNVGGKQMMRMSESTLDTIKLGDGSDVDINLNDNVYIDHVKRSVNLFTTAKSDVFSLYAFSQKRGGFGNYTYYAGAGDAYGSYQDVDFSGTDGRCYGLYVDVTKNGANTQSSFALYGNVTGWGNGSAYGTYHDIVSYGTYTYPVYGIYVQGRDYQDGTTYDRYSYGVWTKAISYYATGTSHSKGIYGTYTGNAETEYAGYFAGSVYTTGSYLPSDQMLKTDVTAHSSSLERIMALKVYDYSYDTVKYGHMNLPSGTQTGFIAQEFRTFFPELTVKAMQQPLTEEELKTYEEMGMPVPEGGRSEVEFTAVNYAGMVPHLTSAIQEQQQTIVETREQLAAQQQVIEELMRQLAELKAQMATMESNQTH